MEASKLEQEYVHRVYEEIAPHFSSTRHSPWPQIVEFLRSLPKGSIVADVGCGNGKYLGINEDLYMVGCDRSKNLVDICGEKNLEAFVCDALSVPMRSGSCDACISIADSKVKLLPCCSPVFYLLASYFHFSFAGEEIGYYP
uniref:Methyltransferase type 11 domain-containing protein n=1 Tax=Amazona collaria TaxID=241587 RepID=A0A8B9FRM2_9PSIT